MSQHDFNVANQGFPAFRSDLNNALAALASTSSGASAPTTTYANQFWYDETNNILKMRDEANANWINLGTLDQVAKTYLPYVNGTAITGMSSQAVAEAGTDNATLMTPLRVAQAIDAQAAGLTANVQEFTSSGTWTKPANAKLVYVEIWGAGSGGSSGARNAAGTLRAGGQSGAGGGVYVGTFRASALTSTVSVTIGAGGAGAPGNTTNSTGSVAGSAGGNSSFGSYANALGAGPTNAGFAVSSGTASGGNGATFQYAGGATGGLHGNSVPYSAAMSGSGGGSGGSITTGNVALNAGLGGGGFVYPTDTLAGTAADGVGNGVNGAAGSGIGMGGGGGGPGNGVTAGSGGAGGAAGGGGGGGGSLNGYTSGAGGAGGNGFCRVTTYS